MAWQSTLDQARSIRLSRNTVIWLVAGIVVGLVLGLLIGWVWWPVEWQGTETAATPAPTAGSQFDSPEARALYLGAVADAFVYGAAAGDADAGSVAAQRLAAMGGDIRAAFNNALTFYGAQAGSATRVNNLTALAAALGIPLSEVAGASADLQAGQPAVQPTAVAPGDTAATTAASENGGVNWLLTLLTALTLIGGGIYILWFLKRRQETGSDSAGFTEEELAPAAAPITSDFERSTLSPVRSGLTPAASVRSTIERPHTSQAGGPHGFDAEDLDEYDESDYAAEDELDENNARMQYRAAGEDPDDATYTEIDAGDDADEWEDETGAEPAGDRHAASSAGFVTAVGAAPPFTGERSSSPGDLRQTQAADETEGISASAAAARTPPAATLQPPTPSRFARYAPVESYTATYFVGRSDFDHTQNIENPGDGKYIGEYGIGIPPSQGLLQDDMKKAVAIDIYLFDKTDERQPLTVKRSLLSLYADDHKRGEFERDKQSLPPIVAQPNTNFQLEGVQLLLDCLIKQVEYTPEGFFKNVIVELVLKRKS